MSTASKISWNQFKRYGRWRERAGILARARNGTKGFLVEHGPMGGACMACGALFAPGCRIEAGQVLECSACGAWFMGAWTDDLPAFVDPGAPWRC